MILSERNIKSRLDMAEIESAIMKELGCENNRCAFLRSKAYMQLRMAALYHVDPEPMTVFHDPICVSLGKGPEGEKKVSVKLLYEPVYDLRFMGSDVEESESPEKKQRH
jgi:hypothetical protein